VKTWIKRNGLLVLGIAAILWMLTRPKTKTVPATWTTPFVGTNSNFPAT